MIHTLRCSELLVVNRIVVNEFQGGRRVSPNEA